MTIDQGIGSVPVQGSIIVSPSMTTTYTITAVTPLGTRSVSITVDVLVITISVTSPTNGSNISRPVTMVEGTIADNPVMGFSLDQYLRQELGWDSGKDTDLQGKTVQQWLEYGGDKEDSPVLRSFNHFHDPTRTWDIAGLWGGNLGRSSIVWAQTPDQPWGFYSWRDVRNYFYSALTSTDQNNSRQLFAKAFRGLGQLMHLVQDASVPLHTRNDIHIIPGHYEYWLEDFRTKVDPDEFAQWLSNTSRYGYDPSLLAINPNPLAPIPIARIVDSDRYDGENPAVKTAMPVGLSEYSNANFVSDDTIFNSYGYPARSSVEIVEYQILDPRNEGQTIFRSSPGKALQEQCIERTRMT